MERLIGFDAQLLADMALTAINVLILFYVLSRLLFNPVRSFLEKRRLGIEGTLEDAARDRELAGTMKDEYEFRLRHARNQVQELLDEGRRGAIKEQTEIVEKARSEAAFILEKADREIERERQKAVEDMKQELAAIASMIAARVLASSMTEEMQEALVDETLREIGARTWQG